jgi:hypothetical protein
MQFPDWDSPSTPEGFLASCSQRSSAAFTFDLSYMNRMREQLSTARALILDDLDLVRFNTIDAEDNICCPELQTITIRGDILNRITTGFCNWLDRRKSKGALPLAEVILEGQGAVEDEIIEMLQTRAQKVSLIHRIMDI